MAKTNLQIEAISKATGGQTVTVCSKLPYNLQLKLQVLEDKLHTTSVGQYKTKEARSLAKTYVINGNSKKMGISFDGAGGYAFTHSIPLEFWNVWVEQHKDDFQPLIDGLIFAHENRDHYEGISKETSSKKSGLEPLRQDLKDTRLGGDLGLVEPVLKK